MKIIRLALAVGVVLGGLALAGPVPALQLLGLLGLLGVPAGLALLLALAGSPRITPAPRGPSGAYPPEPGGAALCPQGGAGAVQAPAPAERPPPPLSWPAPRGPRHPGPGRRPGAR